MTREIDCLLIGYTEFSLDYVNERLDKMGIQIDKVVEPFNPAVAYLGTYLSRRSFTMDYVNSIKDEEELFRKLTSQKVRTVGISTTLCSKVDTVVRTVKLVKACCPSVKVILGGQFIVSLLRNNENDARVLQYFLRTIGADFYIDSFQGEAALVNIVNAVKNGLPWNDISNIYHINGREYVYTGRTEEYGELEENMVDWRLFAERLNKVAAVRTAISCPFTCAFCTYPLNTGKHKYVSVEKIEQELDLIEQTGKVKIVQFVDDTFNVPLDRFKDIMRMMIRKQYSFKWYSYFRCQYADREAVELMKKSGCEWTLLGIESGNQEMLNRMNKSVNIDAYKKGIALLNEYEIASFAFFIVGFPGETLESIRDTIAFIEETKPTFFFADTWFNDPRTPINNYKDKYGIRGIHNNWSHNTMDALTAQRLTAELFKTVSVVQ